jgi:T-complex protein 1 subunit alpha
MEPSVSKVKIIKAATGAAIALQRIDDIITIDKKEQQDDGHGH